MPDRSTWSAPQWNAYIEKIELFDGRQEQAMNTVHLNRLHSRVDKGIFK